MDISKELKIGVALTVLFLGIVTFLFVNKVGSSSLIGSQVTVSTLQNTATPTKSTTIATSYTLNEVAQHNTQADCWLIISNNVYNATNYLFDHPGGAQNIIAYCGTDATAVYEGMSKHSSYRAKADLTSLLIGVIK